MDSTIGRIIAGQMRWFAEYTTRVAMGAIIEGICILLMRAYGPIPAADAEWIEEAARAEARRLVAEEHPQDIATMHGVLRAMSERIVALEAQGLQREQVVPQQEDPMDTGAAQTSADLPTIPSRVEPTNEYRPAHGSSSPLSQPADGIEALDSDVERELRYKEARVMYVESKRDRKRAQIEKKFAKADRRRLERKANKRKHRLIEGNNASCEGSDEKLVCQMCNRKFLSGNKVHQHIREDHEIGGDGLRKNDSRSRTSSTRE
ncbi:uncharacterized protein RCC_05911 [Ramularia collo-cygni]|uniref:C2H2-type domain-containing protein n=1 Tax=Ramularia collo-cygni TaxID=112498 RepID=A0A2D3VBG9_9PEZI|nr:uncharacterized protein RCC_05911 [Ramularia collo-cygni]CZT20054.1 uncharacterized protein RCC_05911 [Ramularia collo-cygni]